MSDSPAEERAERHDRLAELMESTEDRMHSSADALPEPNRTRQHDRADAISEQARSHKRHAEQIRKRAN